VPPPTTAPFASVWVNVPDAVTDFGWIENTPLPVMLTRSPFGASAAKEAA
jgi:hypothetical protein